MEVFRFSSPLPDRDLIHWIAARRPHIVVVDTGCHNRDEHFVGSNLGRSNYLWQERRAGGAITVWAPHLGVHFSWHHTKRLQLPNVWSLLPRRRHTAAL